jgi:hypothetical protein
MGIGTLAPALNSGARVRVVLGSPSTSRSWLYRRPLFCEPRRAGRKSETRGRDGRQSAANCLLALPASSTGAEVEGNDGCDRILIRLGNVAGGVTEVDDEGETQGEPEREHGASGGSLLL